MPIRDESLRIAKRGSRVRPQSGAALLLMMLVILVAATALLVSRLDRSTLRTRQVSDSQHALAAAKQALIDYAATYADLSSGTVITLPCPDIDSGGSTLNGESHTANCAAAGVTVLGRFPWRSLATPAYRDSSGECLWYAVSGTYKNAGVNTDVMINPDTNGQLELYSVETGGIVLGGLPEDRPVAMLFAPQEPVQGQVRGGSAIPGSECSDNFAAAEFLDTDSGSGISNSTVSGNPMALENFVMSAGSSDLHNDRILSVSRAEVATAIYERPDFAVTMDTLTRAIAACVADWGLGNPAAGDRRLPWPAAVALADYRFDANYTDVSGGILSGRLANDVSDSSSSTGNGITQLLGSCDPAAVPEWNAGQWRLWQNWKDHFFYAVAEAFGPGAAVPNSCGSCFTVNGTGAYAAIIVFSGARLQALGQRRNAPPLDADTRNTVGNYLEGRNASNHPYTSGPADFESRVPDGLFNDIAYCIDAAMNVSAC